MSTALSATPRVGPSPWTRGAPWWVLTLVCAAVTARLTMVSVQLGATAALLVLVVGLYVRSRNAGLLAVWAVWLISPFVRRVFFLSDPIENADPLALAPFLVTAAVIALELRQVDLSRRAKRLLKLVVAGYAIGVPFGLLISPTSGAFATFAYLTAAGCFVIGYRDGGRREQPALVTILLITTPFLAVYGFYQYFLDLPEWDFVWFNTADINTAGSPDGDRVRVWSTLNSPGTFSLILGVAGVAFVALGRLSPVRVAGLLAILAALALTYVRSSWIGVAAALVVLAFATRGAIVRQVGPIALVAIVLAPIAFGGAVGGALGERVNTLGELGTDESAQDRIARPVRLVPVAVQQPLGRGVGQAGEATRLNDSGGFRYTDNGFLSLMFQVGPIGFLLVVGGLVMALRSAWRNVWRRRPEAAEVLALGVLAFLTVTMLAGDQFYGVGGMILWYMGGLAVRRGEADA